MCVCVGGASSLTVQPSKEHYYPVHSLTFLSSSAASMRYCQSIHVPHPLDTFSSIRSTIFLFVSSSSRKLSVWLAHCVRGVVWACVVWECVAYPLVVK